MGRKKEKVSGPEQLQQCNEGEGEAQESRPGRDGARLCEEVRSIMGSVGYHSWITFLLLLCFRKFILVKV